MDAIKVEHNPAESWLNGLGVRGWPVWTKEPSTLPWSYDERERCYLLEGDVTVTPDGASRCSSAPATS